MRLHACRSGLELVYSLGTLLVGRILRYLAPNLVTAIGLTFGLLSVVATHQHRFVDAAWLMLWAVLIDRIDGFVARLLRATSRFGMQMDSFADFLNFGCAPAFLVYVSLGLPEVGLTGAGRGLLAVACLAWVLATVARLARFNVVSESPEPGKPQVFFGMPTTLAAGLVVVWYLVFLKYADPAGALAPPTSFGGPLLLTGWSANTALLRPIPVAMLVMSIMMVSNLPMPKLGRLRSRTLTAVVFGCVGSGYLLGFAKAMPELLVWMPLLWVVASVGWGVFSEEARNLKPAPLFTPAPVGSGSLDAAFVGLEEDDEDEEPLVEIEPMGR